MLDSLFVTTLPENAQRATTYFETADLVSYLALVLVFLGVNYLFQAAAGYLHRMPKQLVFWGKLVISAVQAAGVVFACQVGVMLTGLPYPLTYNPVSLIFFFLIIKAAFFVVYSNLHLNGRLEKGGRTLIALGVLAGSLVIGHGVLIHGTGFEGQVFYLKSLYLQFVMLGVLFLVLGLLLMEITRASACRKASHPLNFLVAFIMAAGVYMFHMANVRSAVYVLARDQVFIQSQQAVYGMALLGATLILFVLGAFYIYFRQPDILLGRNRLFGFRWVRLVPVFACLVFGVAASLALFSTTHYAEKKYKESQFKADSRVVVDAIGQNMREIVSSLDMLAAFFKVFEGEVSAESFQTFSNQKILKDRVLGIVGYMALENGMSYMALRHVNPPAEAAFYSGRLLRRPPESHMFHTRNSPAGGGEGGDNNEASELEAFLWQQAYAAVFRRSFDIGSLSFLNSHQPGALSFIRPLYKEQRRFFRGQAAAVRDLDAFISENVSGFIIVTADLRPLIHKTLKITGVEGVALRVNHNDAVLYQDERWREKYPHDGATRRSLGGATFTFQLQATGRALKADGLMKWGVLVLGLFITGLLTSYFYMVLLNDRRNRKVQKKQAAQIDEIQKLNQEIESARQEAEAASLAKDEFLANMSHEIRTPMNGMMGMTDLLKESALDPDQKKMVAMLRRSGDNLMTILNDILDVSKIRAGQMQIDETVFSVREVVEDVADLFAANCAEKGIAFNSSLHKDVPDKMLGDPLRIKQVLLNLVSNAIKFTEKGSVSLEVNTRRCNGSKMVVAFHVRDTGIGIEEDKINEVFAKFSQVESATTRRFGGTGLGLAICKNLSEMMGGAIKVTSKLGKGSTFTFYVPLRDEAWCDVPSIQTAEPRLKQKKGQALGGVTRQLLVVEDNEINRELMARFLAYNDLEVDYAADGEEAVAKVRDKQYDLVFMDCQMPNMDGFEATVEIRKLEQQQMRGRLTIVALTASAMAADKERCLAAGMDAYLSKPIKKENILDALKQWLDRNAG